MNTTCEATNTQYTRTTHGELNLQNICLLFSLCDLSVLFCEFPLEMCLIRLRLHASLDGILDTILPNDRQ